MPLLQGNASLQTKSQTHHTLETYVAQQPRRSTESRSTPDQCPFSPMPLLHPAMQGREELALLLAEPEASGKKACNPAKGAGSCCQCPSLPGTILVQSCALVSQGTRTLFGLKVHQGGRLNFRLQIGIKCQTLQAFFAPFPKHLVHRCAPPREVKRLKQQVLCWGSHMFTASD